MTAAWRRLVEPYWFDRQLAARQSAAKLRAAGYRVRVRGAVRGGQGPARWWYVEYRDEEAPA